MTKEDIYKNFLEDSLLVDKNYISAERIQELHFYEPSGIKLLEIIKLTISGNIDGESDTVIVRKINQSLNK